MRGCVTSGIHRGVGEWDDAIVADAPRRLKKDIVCSYFCGPRRGKRVIE